MIKRPPSLSLLLSLAFVLSALSGTELTVTLGIVPCIAFHGSSVHPSAAAYSNLG